MASISARSSTEVASGARSSSSSAPGLSRLAHLRELLLARGRVRSADGNNVEVDRNDIHDGGGAAEVDGDEGDDTRMIDPAWTKGDYVRRLCRIMSTSC